MNNKDRGILIGMILGDGYLQSGTSTTLKLEHSTHQLDYLLHKSTVLHSIFGGKLPKIHIFDRHDSRTNKTYQRCYSSKSNAYLKTLKGWIYLNGKKEYTRHILDFLTPEGIAFWYMDDGGCHVSISKITNKISSGQSYLYTYCSENEALIIQAYFLEVHSIAFSIHKRKNGQCCMCANTQNSRKFVELIRPYIIESMQYKLRHMPISNIQEPQTPQGDDIV